MALRNRISVNGTCPVCQNASLMTFTVDEGDRVAAHLRLGDKLPTAQIPMPDWLWETLGSGYCERCKAELWAAIGYSESRIITIHPFPPPPGSPIVADDW